MKIIDNEFDYQLVVSERCESLKRDASKYLFFFRTVLTLKSDSVTVSLVPHKNHKALGVQGWAIWQKKI